MTAKPGPFKKHGRDLATAAGFPGGLELEYPARLVFPPSWVGHIPFAFWIVETVRPASFVELGVHTGLSYCAFLQAVQTLRIGTRCFGIDHWKGEEHAGVYGEEIYQELAGYHDPRYGGFSTLLRLTFDEALPLFPDGSIDLLHLDGFHTYEAASQDFNNWLPKMSPRGIMLFHDVNVRDRDFGVWQLWEEIGARFPTFEFVHSHGLGIAHVGNEPLPEALEVFFDAKTNPDALSRTRTYFSRLGRSLLERYELGVARSEAQAATELNSELKRRTEALDAEHSRLQSALEEERSRLQEVAQGNSRLQAELEAERVQRTVLLQQEQILAIRIRQDLALKERTIQEVEAQLISLRSSTSWRVTRPLRSLTTRFPRLVRFIKEILRPFWRILRAILPLRHRP